MLSVQIRKTNKEVSSYEEASALVQKFVNKSGIGASRFPGVLIYNTLNVPVAHISYNGRVWKGSDYAAWPKTEIMIDKELTNKFYNL